MRDLTSSTHLIPGARLPSAAGPQQAAATLPATADVVVVGAGIIGLAIAWRLAQRGQRVVVVERGQVGSGASLAATGMLAATAEYEAGGDILIDFARASQTAWEGFARELEAATGIQLDFDRTGTILVALNRDETARLRAKFELHQKIGLQSAWLSGSDVRALEPGLRPSVVAGLHCPLDFQVDPRRVMPALAQAARQSGVTLVEHCDVTGFAHQAGRVAGIITPLGECAATTVILTTGAYAGAGSLLPPDLALPVRPLRGQSLCLQAPAGQVDALTHMVWTEQVHLAPKAGGQLIVGATVEEIGFDPHVTAGGMLALLDGARRALPGIEDWAVTAIWSGFRPTSEDDAPILGDSGLPGLLLAVGHHRNGILLAPSTADALSALVLGEAVAPSAQILSRQRFGRRT